MTKEIAEKILQEYEDNLIKQLKEVRKKINDFPIDKNMSGALTIFLLEQHFNIRTLETEIKK